MNACSIRPSAAATALAVACIASSCFATARAGDAPGRSASGAALVGGALPGGAIISAKSVGIVPVAGGPVTGIPIAADGSFRAAGLAAGSYRLAVTSTTVPKQTQGATFGEKVNAGLHAAGSAVAQGAARLPDANSMPNRISMNLTVAKRTQQVVVDDTVVTVDVGDDGVLAGRVATP